MLSHVADPIMGQTCRVYSAVSASVAGAVAAVAYTVSRQGSIGVAGFWREYVVSVYEEDTGELLVRTLIQGADDMDLLGVIEEFLEEEFGLRASCVWGVDELACSLCSSEGCADVIVVVE